jgi:1-acyl-sn-glycerol-3-phosphate acyltransferase
MGGVIDDRDCTRNWGGMMAKRNAPAEAKTQSIEIRGWYGIVYFIVSVFFRLIARVETVGQEYIPDSGPFILVTNHLHWLDPPLVGIMLPYRATIFAAEKWEVHWLLGPLLRSMDAIFVRRGEVDRKALREALAVLKGGGILGMAPEGTRSKTGGLQEGRSGASYLAYRTGTKVLPVVSWGQEEVFSALRHFRRGTLHVVFGPPFEPPAVEGKASAARVGAFSEEIMYRLAAMLPPKYRGVYSDVAEERPDLLLVHAAETAQ